MEIGLKRKTGNCAVPNAAECFLFTAQFNGEVLNAELPALGGVNGVGGEGDKGEGGKGLGCVGRGARCSVGGRKFGVTAALDPTQLCAESALCVCVSPPPKKNPDDNTTKKPNLELQRSDDRKEISQLMVCEGIRVGERIKQTQQKE